MCSTIGIRYKKHVVYMNTTYKESFNSSIKRLWFITRNIAKESYSILSLYSKYYYYSTFCEMMYDDTIHTKIKEIESI